MPETNGNDISLPCTDLHSVVISLHGVKTRGTWQKRLTSSLNAAGFVHEPLDYGYFPALQLLFPGQREKKTDWFLEEYTRMREQHSGRKPSVIAHSFGTYIVANCMEKYPDVEFDRIIFCGSIVRRDYPWSSRVKAGSVSKVLNDFGRLDCWARIGQWFVRDAGPSGLTGFDDEADGAVVQRCHPQFRHSDYFYLLNYQNNWIPFLKGNDLSKIPHERLRARNWRFAVVRLVFLVALAILTWRMGDCLFRWLLPPRVGIDFPDFVRKYHKAKAEDATGVNLKRFMGDYNGHRVAWYCHILKVDASHSSYRIGPTEDPDDSDQYLAIFHDESEFNPSLQLEERVKIDGIITLDKHGVMLTDCHFVHEER